MTKSTPKKPCEIRERTQDPETTAVVTSDRNDGPPLNVAAVAVAADCGLAVRADTPASGAPVMPVVAGSIDWPASVRAPVRTPLVMGLGTTLTVGDGREKVRSNSRRAKAASVHSAGVGPGVPGAVLAANGLRAALTTLGTISATWSTALMTDTIGGVVAVGVCTATATTRLASTLLVGLVVSAGGAFGVAAVRVAVAAGEPGSADAVVGRADAIATVIVDPPPDSLGPATSFGRAGAGALGRRGPARRCVGVSQVRLRPAGRRRVRRGLAGSRRGSGAGGPRGTGR